MILDSIFLWFLAVILHWNSEPSMRRRNQTKLPPYSSRNAFPDVWNNIHFLKMALSLNICAEAVGPSNMIFDGLVLEKTAADRVQGATLTILLILIDRFLSWVPPLGHFILIFFYFFFL